MFLFLGVHFLHSMKYIHRDIKPANVLRYKSPDDIAYTYKIADFGLAVEFSNRTDLSTICGTKRFMAPEMDGTKQYGKEIDIWSLGVLFYSLLIGKHAQVNASKEETYKPIKESSLCKPIFPQDLQISNKTQDLINSMLNNNPARRCFITDVEHQLCYPAEGYLKSHANRTADSGIASSCTSGSSSANGSGVGFSRNMNAYSYDRNILPVTLESVTEEQTAIESGIENYSRKRSVTPRNTFRVINNDNANVVNRPLKPTNRDQYSIGTSQALPFSPIPRQNTLSTNYMPTPTTYSSTIEPSHRNREVCAQKPHRLNTSRLRPSTKEHKMNKGTYCIMQNLSVKLELNIEKRSKEPSTIGVLKETVLINATGNEIIIRRNGLKSSETTYLYNELPQKYWAKYKKAAEFVKSLKANTPKITWSHENATCKLMENGSYIDGQIQDDANFVVDFDSGVKFEYDALKRTVKVSDKFEERIVPVDNLESVGDVYVPMCNLFKIYHEETKQIESLHERLQANNRTGSNHFPLKIGNTRLPTSSSSVIPTSTNSHVSTYNNENRNFLANQNRIHSSGELYNRAVSPGYHNKPSSGRYSPRVLQTQSSPNVLKYNN